MKLEKRYSPLDKRGKTISGYAIYWDRESDIGGYKERFAKDSLKESDSGTSLYFQHNKERLLGNTKGGTLELEPDDKGLRYKATLPDSASDIVESIERKDIQGVSVGFYSLKDDIQGNTREVQDALLVELSLVDKPAHETSLSMRFKTIKTKTKHWSKLILGV